MVSGASRALVYVQGFTGLAAFFKKVSRSLRLNGRFPFVGFWCIRISPRAAHLRMVFWATPKYSAAAAVCRYSVNLFNGYVPLAPIAPVMRQRAKVLV